MYIEIGDSLFVKGSILSVSAESEDKAIVYMANGDGTNTLEIETHFDEKDARERVSGVCEELSEHAEDKREKMQARRQMQGGGGGRSLA